MKSKLQQIRSPLRRLFITVVVYMVLFLEAFDMVEMRFRSLPAPARLALYQLGGLAAILWVLPNDIHNISPVIMLPIVWAASLCIAIILMTLLPQRKIGHWI